MFQRVALRYEFAPEVIVEGEVEHRAVHVEQHPVGRLPVHQMCVRKIVHAFMIRTMATSDEVFDAIVRIAIEAGEKIMAIYRGEFAVTRKNDDSQLTQRSDEHTPELQSLMRSTNVVFCLQKKQQSTQLY